MVERRIVQTEIRGVVEEPPLTSVLHDAVMVGAAVDRVEDNSSIGEWTQGIVGCAIGDTRLVSVKGAVAVGEVIGASRFVHPSRFEEFGNAFQEVHLSVV